MNRRDLDRYKRVLVEKRDEISVTIAGAESPIPAAGGYRGDTVDQANANTTGSFLSSSIQATIVSSPTASRRFVNTNGRSPRIFRESRSITSSEAPTYGARSILFITRRFERVIPGPPLRGILSPSATSIT